MRLAAAALTLWACAAAPPPAERLDPSELPRRVAVLPFVNRTSNPEAAAVLRRMFYNFFSSLAYLDIEPAVVDASLEASGLAADIRAGQLPSLERLGQLLEADAVIVGEALGLGQTYALLYANQQASLRARMLDCRSGRVLWQAERTVTVHGGDLPLSLPGLAASLVKTAITYQQADVFGAAAELCRQMVATVPEPAGPPDPAPAIRVLVHNAAGRLLQPGDELRAVLVGEPRQRAFLSLPPILDQHPMEEKDPGVYVASYRILPGDGTGGESRMIATLRSVSGAGRQWVDTLGEVRIGTPTVLPAAIAADTVLTRERSPYLVEDVLVVLPAATLSVEPGVAVWFQGRGMIVRGRIEAQGTAELPVVFGGVATKGWKGVFVDASPGENHFRFCRVSGAEYGVRAVRSELTVERCRFQDNAWALVVEEGRLEVTASLIRASHRAGIAARGADIRVTGSIVAENGGGGILAESSAAQIHASAIVDNRGWGIRAAGEAAAVEAAGNWWGTDAPDAAVLAPGGVRIHPVLAVPIEFADAGGSK